jgi:hypothetical protein
MVRSTDRIVEKHWELFGFEELAPYLTPVEKYASTFIADWVEKGFKRTYFAIDVWHESMCVITAQKDILRCITIVLSSYRPEIDGNTLCRMFQNLKCVVVGERDTPAKDTELKFVPMTLVNFKEPLANIHVALGYYNAYREYARADYGVRLPKIELKGED